MDTYQAVYDAVRSRMGTFDAAGLQDRIVQSFDFSHAAALIQQGFQIAAYEQARPCVLYRPSVSIDGDQWCALYGDNLQGGVAGFGKSPALAMTDFDKNWDAALNIEVTP